MTLPALLKLAKFGIMGRKRITPETQSPEVKTSEKKEEATARTRQKEDTAMVRIEAGLARKLAVAASILETTVAELLSPEIRPFVEQVYAKAVRKAQEDVKPELK